MFNRELIVKIVRFGVVGTIVTGSFMALNWLLAPRFGRDLGFLLAYPPAVLLHFCLNKWWTFGDQSQVGKKQVSEYVILTVTVFIIQAAIFRLLITFTPMASWLASGVATVAQMALAFVVMHKRVFAKSAV